MQCVPSLEIRLFFNINTFQPYRHSQNVLAHATRSTVLSRDSLIHSCSYNTLSILDRVEHLIGTHQQFLRCLPIFRFLHQTRINERLRRLGVSPLRRQPGSGLIHNMLQKLQYTHRHATSLQTDAFASALVLLLLLRCERIPVLLQWPSRG